MRKDSSLGQQLPQVVGGLSYQFDAQFDAAFILPSFVHDGQ